jgi:hypothetical protein
MSPEMKPVFGAAEPIHERARMLAAESVDGPLGPGDAEWLDAHLGSCPDCAAVAEEYRSIHAELRSLTTPEPPRDLWARTSAALDLVDAKAARRSPGKAGAARQGSRPLVATTIAVGCVVVVAAASLLAQSPVIAPATAPTRSDVIAVATPSPAQSGEAQGAPLAVVNGTSYWIASDAGVYQIKGGATQCTAADGSCSVASGGGNTLGSIASDQSVSAAIAPDASQAAVWTSDKVVILPLATKPQTVSIDLLTPKPTLAATPTARPTATSAGPAATASAGSSTAPSASASAGAVQTPTPAPTATPIPSAPATPAPLASAPAATHPIAILSGYEIVGRDPEFSADGSLVAFAARPVDHSTGPDVFLWRSGQEQATRITFRHSGLFAGWYDGRILISEISPAGAGSANAGHSTSYIWDPSTGKTLQFGRPMLLPAVDPTGKYLVYWAGAVQLDPATGLWGPASGDLYFDTWTDLAMTPASFAPFVAPTASPSPSPSAAVTPSAVPTLQPSPAETSTAAPTEVASTPSSQPSATAGQPQSPLPQVLAVAAAPNMVHGWVVAWDTAGGHVAVWVADPGSARIGRLSLFAIDRTNGRVETNEPLLAADKVTANISFDAGHLVYTSAIDGKTYMQAVPAVPPSTAATPVPATPGPSPSGAPTSASPSPSVPPTDRPGN